MRPGPELPLLTAQQCVLRRQSARVSIAAKKFYVVSGAKKSIFIAAVQPNATLPAALRYVGLSKRKHSTALPASFDVYWSK
jgi:hypothetical protein